MKQHCRSLPHGSTSDASNADLHDTIRLENIDNVRGLCFPRLKVSYVVNGLPYRSIASSVTLHHRMALTIISSMPTRVQAASSDINISNEDDSKELISRSEALAQAKPLDSPDVDDCSLPIIAESVEDLVRRLPERAQEPSQHLEIFHSLQCPGEVIFPSLCAASVDGPDVSRPDSTLLSPQIPELDPEGPGQAGTPSLLDKEVADQVKAATTCNEAKQRRRSNSRYLMRTYSRGRTSWTKEESDYLIKGVTIYGKGRWKDILEHPQLYFQEGRTAADLKDR